MIRSLLLSSRKAVIPAAEVAQRLQIPEAQATEALRELEASGRARMRPGGVLLDEVASSLKEEIARRVCEASAGDPLRGGVPREEVRRNLSREVDLSLFQALLAESAKDGKTELRGEMLFPGGGELPEKARRLAERVEKVLGSHRLAPPLAAQIASEAGAEAREVNAVLELLSRLGRTVKVAPGLVYRREEIEELRALLLRAFAEKGPLSVAEFKERTGLSRKYAVPLLEYFDQVRWTRREGDLRVAGPALNEEKPR
jgi:selenocysteine-specific elongation factor